MSNDIQKETERIHQGIVESLSFSEALARRDAEIERLRDKALRFDLDQAGIERREREAVELVEGRAEIERLNQQIESRDFLLEERRLKIEQLCAENECLDAEIERLREDATMLKQHIGLHYAAEQDAEIERLRREHEKAWADAQLKAAEIALLKKRFRDLEQERRHLRAAMDLREKDHREKTAENERLREGYEQCRATLKHIAADRDEKEAEVKRLCRLLSEYDTRLRKALKFTVMSGEQAEWAKDAKTFLGVKDGLPEI